MTREGEALLAASCCGARRVGLTTRRRPLGAARQRPRPPRAPRASSALAAAMRLGDFAQRFLHLLRALRPLWRGRPASRCRRPARSRHRPACAGSAAPASRAKTASTVSSSLQVKSLGDITSATPDLAADCALRRRRGRMMSRSVSTPSSVSRRADEHRADVEFRHLHGGLLHRRRRRRPDRRHGSSPRLPSCPARRLPSSSLMNASGIRRVPRSGNAYHGAVGQAPQPSGQAVEQVLQIKPLRGHGERAVGVARPFLLRAVAVELDAVPVRIAQIERLADAVVAGPVERDAGLDRAGAARRRAPRGSDRGWRGGKGPVVPGAGGAPPWLSQVLRPMWW